MRNFDFVKSIELMLPTMVTECYSEDMRSVEALPGGLTSSSGLMLRICAHKAIFDIVRKMNIRPPTRIQRRLQPELESLLSLGSPATDRSSWSRSLSSSSEPLCSLSSMLAMVKIARKKSAVARVVGMLDAEIRSWQISPGSAQIGEPTGCHIVTVIGFSTIGFDTVLHHGIPWDCMHLPIGRAVRRTVS